MSVKLYIEGFPSTLTDDELAKLFSPHGVVVSAPLQEYRGRVDVLRNVEMVKGDRAIKALHQNTH